MTLSHFTLQVALLLALGICVSFAADKASIAPRRNVLAASQWAFWVSFVVAIIGFFGGFFVYGYNKVFAIVMLGLAKKLYTISYVLVFFAAFKRRGAKLQTKLIALLLAGVIVVPVAPLSRGTRYTITAALLELDVPSAFTKATSLTPLWLTIALVLEGCTIFMLRRSARIDRGNFAQTPPQ